MRKSFALALTLSLLIVCSLVVVDSSSEAHEIAPLASALLSNSYPAYAKVGAFANYSGSGGFIAFLSGVSTNITYDVTGVYSNNTMEVFVNATISLGTEIQNDTSTYTMNLTDSIYSPKVMPVIPPQDINADTIVFQNVTCNFVKDVELTVSAGTYNAAEFQGKNANGTMLQFWFDRDSGLALEMVEPGSYIQLIQTNIATPLSVQSQFSSYLPYIVIFIVGWAGAGLCFFAVIRHYSHKGRKATPMQNVENKSKPKQQELEKRKTT
jgi:hypothetical protein